MPVTEAGAPKAPKEGAAGEAGRQELDRYAGRTVLGIGAHPDDLELGVGGTLARLSRGGARVVMAVVCVPSHLEQRLREARRAAEILGCADLRFIVGDRCSRVEDLKHHELVSRIDALVTELKPAAMFSHCQANFHVDHKLVHDACMAAQRLAYFDAFCYSPTSCMPINVSFYPHAYVDITGTIEAKMEAIRAHWTQFERRGLTPEHYRETATRNGQVVGVDYAEGLEVVRMRFP